MHAVTKGLPFCVRNGDLHYRHYMLQVAVAIGTRVVNVHGSEPVLAVGCRNIKVKCQEVSTSAYGVAPSLWESPIS